MIAHKLISFFVALSMVLTPTAPAQPVQSVSTSVEGQSMVSFEKVEPQTGVLFRTHITVDQPTDWARLGEMGVVILDQGKTDAMALTDFDQLANLARLGFRPTGTDEFTALVTANGGERPWLIKAVAPVMERSKAMQAQVAQRTLGLVSAEEAETMQALTSLRTAVQALTPEVKAALADSFSLDDDGDGLTNTEEVWWCTDPLNPNSDGDAQGYTDGQEVTALLDITQPRNLRWGYGAPFGPPNAWPNFNNRDNTGVKVCNDGDFDTIPDYAEAYMVGTRVPAETTDNDKFDDGQELFGITYCPGAPTNCGYGSYPAIEYWNFIKAPMPNWVLPPGDSPFVAAFPVPEVYVEPNSWNVERVTTITTTEGEMAQATHSYETSVTRGESTSIADTVTWNEWEEVSESVERPLTRAAFESQRAAECEPPGSLKCRAWGGAKILGGGFGGLVSGAGALGLGAICVVPDPTDLTIVVTPAACVGAVALGGASTGAFKAAGSGWKDLTASSAAPNEVQEQIGTTKYDINNTNINNVSANAEAHASITLNQNFDFQGVVNSLDGVQYAINQQGELLSRGLQDISYQISRPRLTETQTNGRSWGGAQTTTHEVYEEHTISQGEAFTTGQNWSTAWAVDSSHAADLTFNYSVQNSGTEYARELKGLVFNIYIGDDKLPTISYPAWEQFPDGKLDNLFPVGPNTPAGVGSSKTFASTKVPLSLEEMKRIDLGERLTVKVESFSYGADELFYTDAVSGGVTVFIEDGVEDGDESVDMYVIPTWGVESVQDVLTRYFPHDEDVDGNLNSLWTPEFNGINSPDWHEHFLSDIAWWNVYLTQSDTGDTPLHQLSAQAGSGILFRFNRDSDRDGYNDRAEFRYYCALPVGHPERNPAEFPGRDYCDDSHTRPEIHPQPEILAGYVNKQVGDVVTVTLALENTGTFDAYGIDAVMYSPDDTTTIGNNTVGGNGKVRPGSHVAVGSIVQAPDLTDWGSSTARPYAGGNYSGDVDRTYTFRAITPGVVSQGSVVVGWEDGTGNTGTLALGDGYHAPLPMDVASGVQVGFNTGTIAAGASFTVDALTPRDTFTFTVNSDPFTPPVIVVSYSDPQGSHRFITPVALTDLGDGLSPFTGQMLDGLKLDVVATAPFAPTGSNTTNLVVNSPHSTTIQDGHLHLNFVSDGTLVLEQSHTLDIPAGPTVFEATWSVADFDAAYNPDGDNLLIAFWTDSEENIIDSAARPFNTFAADPRPVAAGSVSSWDFGTVTQGEVLERTISVASVGDLDLLAYVSAPAGLSVSQTGSKQLSPGDVAHYQLILDTRTVTPTGPYNGTVTLRTSDPAQPVYTVQVSGTIAPLVGDAYARKIVDRPLDVEVWIPGDRNQGEWIAFNHPIGPQPESIHPVKVLGQDSNVLFGVGQYATDFAQGTAPGTMFGDGRNGVKVISGVETFNAPRSSLATSALAGQTNISIAASAGFGVGDEILVIQMQGAGAGVYEFGYITAVSNNVLTLARNIGHTYTQGGNSRAQIVKVFHYSDVTVTSSGRWLAPAWDGNTGGVLVYRNSGPTMIEGGGYIDASTFGFRGGAVRCVSCWGGNAGEGYPGVGSEGTSANGNGGGGGQSDPSPRGGSGDASGGGGGGHGSAGESGQSARNTTGGAGGAAVGNLALNPMYMGGGGGAGGAGDNGGREGGAGGNGGGIVMIASRQLTVSGAIYANGQAGYWGEAAGGGGGAGGSIWIQVSKAALGPVYATAGSYGGGSDARGGSGGTGRVRVEHCETITGSSNPPAISQKMKCHISEQLDPVTTRLNLPETSSGGKSYRIQYGRKMDFAVAGEMTATLRVPTGLWTASSLDALISGVGSGDVNLKLDVGNDGTWDWEATQSIANAGTLSSPDLAASFASFVGGVGDRDVEVKVYLSKPGQVLLTNMVVERNQSVELSPTFTLSGTPTEGEAIALNATVNNNGAADNGPVVVSYYGQQGTQQNYVGSVFLDSIPANGQSNALFLWHSLGFTGPVTVTAVVDPFNRTAEVNEFNNSAEATLTILTRSDLSVAKMTLSDGEPTAGEAVEVSLPLKNAGQTTVAASLLKLWVEQPDGSMADICQKSPAVAAEGQSTQSCAWIPSMPGLHRLFVQTDVAGAVDEFDEENNLTWQDVYVGMASPLALDSGGGTDPAYDPASGYGSLNGQASTLCGTDPDETQRTDASGSVQYRFDHLLPGHFYHLDVVLYECDNVDRQEQILVDGNVYGQVVDLADGQVHRASFLLDPAFYTDRSIVVEIQEILGNNAVVSQISLHDVDYRYIDAGSPDEVAYTSAVGYGWMDGSSQSNFGTLPYQTRRIDTGDNELRYRFDGLDAANRYQVHFTFYQATGSQVQHTIAIDDIDTGRVIDLDGQQRVDTTINVPVGTYQTDGSIIVRIVRTDAQTGAFVNVLALEELTTLSSDAADGIQNVTLHGGSPNWVSFNVRPAVEPPTSCTGVVATNAFTILSGSITLAGQPAPPGTVVEAYSPRGEKVGCFQITTPGIYGYMRVYGAEGSTPGMGNGEAIWLKVNGIPADPSPFPVIWTNDITNHEVTLTAEDLIPVETLLQSIQGNYSRLLCQDGSFLPPPADPRFNNCKTVESGQGYLLYADAGTLNLAGTPVVTDTPIELQAGWNWLGYLPTCSLTVPVALGSIDGLYTLIHNEGGTYSPPPANPAFNNFKAMAPGLGYMIHMTADATLTYPADQCGVQAADLSQPTLDVDATCSATPTSRFSSYFGEVKMDDRPVDAGAKVLALSPRGEVVGCGEVHEGGLYGYLRVYGQDGELPGMQPGETVSFVVNGLQAGDEPVWQDDYFVHEVDLRVSPLHVYLPALAR